MTSPVEVLLIEDNEDHAFLTLRALRDNAIDGFRVRVVASAGEALAFIRREGEHANAPRPDLILLDINLPDTSGIEVLRELKRDAASQVIPVLMLTTSDAEADVVDAYRAGAASYITKPVNAAAFQDRVRAIPSYWNRVSRLPPRSA